MVKIAIAGGSGNVAGEVIDALVATKKHEIVILSRKEAPSSPLADGVSWVKADYSNFDELTEIFQGVHTVLSFAAEQEDPTAPVQRRLIDAAVKAGVKRFAPSEWATSNLEATFWYAYKQATRDYLKELNKDRKVLEYTLFQPGLFTNYFTNPYKSSKNIHQMENMIDFNKRRALILEGSENDIVTLTTSQDLANVVARAIEFEGEWPVVGGISGTRTSIGELIKLGEKIRGGPFAIEELKADELKAGTWQTSWVPRIDHPTIPKDQVEVFSRLGVAGITLAISGGAYDVSDEWNRLLPDYKFTQAEEFLEEAWRGKP